MPKSPRVLVLIWAVSVLVSGAILLAFNIQGHGRHAFAFTVSWSAYAVFTAVAFAVVARACQ